MKKTTWLKIGVSVLVTAVLCRIASSGILTGIDGSVSDLLYQRPGMTDGEIVVIGMDQRAVEELGPMPWPRDIMADVVACLNSDPDEKPAVIGIDVLYVGESADPEADAYFAEIAAEGENVVVASAATFGNSIVDNGDSFYLDERAVLYWDSPYPDLDDVTDSGHINAMADSDGIIRHALLFVDHSDGGREYSFARVIYERWCQERGTEPNPLPETVDNGFFYLPYTARGGSYYENVSVIDFLDGLVDPADFAGKIVLIGPYAAGMRDEYRTAIPKWVLSPGSRRHGPIDRPVSDLRRPAVLPLGPQGAAGDHCVACSFRTLDHPVCDPLPYGHHSACAVGAVVCYGFVCGDGCAELHPHPEGKTAGHGYFWTLCRSGGDERTAGAGRRRPGTGRENV